MTNTVAMTDEKYEATMAEIERLTAENERLREALKPFADWHEAYRWGRYPKDMCLPDDAHLKAWEGAHNAYQQKECK